MVKNSEEILRLADSWGNILSKFSYGVPSVLHVAVGLEFILSLLET